MYLYLRMFRVYRMFDINIYIYINIGYSKYLSYIVYNWLESTISPAAAASIQQCLLNPTKLQLNFTKIFRVRLAAI